MGRGRQWRPKPAGHPRCVYCGENGTTDDHVIPLAQGGFRNVSNRVCACLRCNGMKSAMTPKEWVDHMKVVLSYIEKHHKIEQDGSITLWVR